MYDFMEDVEALKREHQDQEEFEQERKRISYWQGFFAALMLWTLAGLLKLFTFCFQ